MLPADQLTLAIEIQTRAYKLLRWVTGAIEKGFIPATRAHEYACISESALDWIEEHHLNLPTEARPERVYLVPFANYFATYMETSFDILEQPGKRLVSPCGCYCRFCSYVVNAPHLQPKKLTSRDKKRAGTLMADRVSTLALEEGIDLPQEDAARIAADPVTRRAAAYSTYGFWLIKRTQGISDGTSILALWRELAWRSSGSPIKDFKLCYADFADAEEALIAAFRSMPPSP